MNPVRRIDTGTLYCGDNLERLREFPDECVDLVYLDPPFFSNKKYEVIWGDEAEVRSFEDRWAGGVRHYIGWMTPRLRELHRILSPTGSLFLHCDPAASHYLKVKLDEPSLFGQANFRNEVVWKRTSAHNDAQRFGRIHDVLLYYAKDARQAKFNRLYRPYDQSYLDAEWRQNEAGEWYKLENLTAPLRGDAGRFDFHGRKPGQTRMWRFNREGMEALWDAGRIKTDKHGVPLLRGHIIYLEDMPGVPLQDWWGDILRVGNTAKERLGYPTQKPEALLERVIESTTDPGDVVLDPFCGCGTTIAVAQRLRREWVGLDISPIAVKIMKRRVESEGATAVKAIDLPMTEGELRALGHFAFQEWIIDEVLGTHSPRKSRDQGVDGYSFFEQLPIQVKQWRKPVGRSSVDEFQPAIDREGKHKGYLVAFSFTSDAYEEAARTRDSDGPEVMLVKVADVMRTGELIDRGDDPSRTTTPDVMGLFKGVTREKRGRSTFAHPSSKPSAEQLFLSLEQQNGVDEPER